MSLPCSPLGPSPAAPRATAQLPEELRFRERLAVSPRPLTAAGGRVWRDQEMDGPSPVPPLPNRFRCCCRLGSGEDAHLCAQLMQGMASLRPYGSQPGPVTQLRSHRKGKEKACGHTDRVVGVRGGGGGLVKSRSG